MREELLLKYLAELQRYEINTGEFNDRIHRVCNEIEKELGIDCSPKHKCSQVTISPESMSGTQIMSTKTQSDTSYS